MPTTVEVHSDTPPIRKASQGNGGFFVDLLRGSMAAPRRDEFTLSFIGKNSSEVVTRRRSNSPIHNGASQAETQAQPVPNLNIPKSMPTMPTVSISGSLTAGEAPSNEGAHSPLAALASASALGPQRMPLSPTRKVELEMCVLL